jgi:hypothetical protein
MEPDDGVAEPIHVHHRSLWRDAELTDRVVDDPLVRLVRDVARRPSSMVLPALGEHGLGGRDQTRVANL